MAEPPNLRELSSPAERVEAVESVYADIRELALEDGREWGSNSDEGLSEPSVTWMGRMRASLVDSSVTQSSFDELNEAFFTYLESLPLEEAKDLQRRLSRFVFVRDKLMELAGMELAR
jgi:hypothetical protein